MVTTTMLSIRFLLSFTLNSSYGFILFFPSIHKQHHEPLSRRFMGDHSSATRFKVGDHVRVIDDVMKMNRNLKGLSGVVVETWEKCDVDPTCCCAEWVDEGLSVHVKFNAPIENIDENDGWLTTNDIFVHYFAESELEMYSESIDIANLSDEIEPNSVVPFDASLARHLN